jgi:hypothetical protein
VHLQIHTICKLQAKNPSNHSNLPQAVHSRPQPKTISAINFHLYAVPKLLITPSASSLPQNHTSLTQTNLQLTTEPVHFIPFTISTLQFSHTVPTNHHEIPINHRPTKKFNL